MLYVKMVLSNEIASPLSPEEFVRKHYLTELANHDLQSLQVEQCFAEPTPREERLDKVVRDLEVAFEGWKAAYDDLFKVAK
jgi:hypothetical protein